MFYWMENELTVYKLRKTEKEEIESAFISDHPFEQICPMPKIIADGTDSRLIGKIFRVLGMNVPETAGRCDSQRSILLKLGTREAIGILKESQELSKEETESGIRIITATAWTGYASRSDWCCDMWGSPEEASEIEIMDNTFFMESGYGDPDFTVRFQTQAGVPAGILQKLSERYPDAVFLLRYIDIDEPFCEKCMGCLQAKEGIQEKVRESDRDDFRKKIFRLTDTQYEDWRNSGDFWYLNA